MAWTTLLILFAACASAASTGALFKPGTWYQGLAKPAWTPPNWLFPVAWTALYVAMAIAAWRFITSNSDLLAPGIALWTWQLTLNAIWSPIFFGLRRLRAGLVTLTLLWCAIAATLIVFARTDGVAAALLVPYWVWISYAGALNLVIWRRNPHESPLLPSEQPRST